MSEDECSTLRDSLDESNRQLAAYREAINKIDDYFEYRRESAIDAKKVYQIIGHLTDRIAKSEPSKGWREFGKGLEPFGFYIRGD